jgi:ribonucleoside-diphosphate reductase alpha chain
MYYLRTKAARDAIKFTVDKDQLVKQSDDGDGQVKQGARTQVPTPSTRQPNPRSEAKGSSAEFEGGASAGFEELSAEQTAAVAKTCSLDDPDCIACSA